ncbi:hypothetical protein WA158_000473 [Blastocystis sp. Blastoise]
MEEAKSSEIDNPFPDQPYYADQIVVAEWKDKTVHDAKIISIRMIQQEKNRKEQKEKYEYYIHFIGYDRRLDEWVTESNFESAKVSIKRKLQETPKNSKRIKEPVDSSPDHENITKIKNIEVIEIGKYEIDTWYFSPYPSLFQTKYLYICEYCLKYFTKASSLDYHMNNCILKHPPGIEIYRDGIISVYEVEGRTNRVFCQNLCLLAKLFLDHKTLYYDVDPFFFYILGEVDQQGFHINGYFSKDRASMDDYNLACILTLPFTQRKGYGRFLISLSYELTKIENKLGSPEKPLSDLGKLSYRSYWGYTLLKILKETKGCISIRDISQKTGMKTDDIISALHTYNLIKYWKGQYVITVSLQNINHLLKNEIPPPLLCNPAKLHWVPPYNNNSTKDAISITTNSSNKENHSSSHGNSTRSLHTPSSYS